MLLEAREGSGDVDNHALGRSQETWITMLLEAWEVLGDVVNHAFGGPGGLR